MKSTKFIFGGATIIGFQNVAVLYLLYLAYLGGDSDAVISSSDEIVRYLLILALVGDIIGFVFFGSGILALASRVQSKSGKRGGLLLLGWSAISIGWRFGLPFAFGLTLTSLASGTVPTSPDAAASLLWFFRLFFSIALLNTLILAAGIFYSAGMMKSLRYETMVKRVARGTTMMVVAGLLNILLGFILMGPFLFALWSGSYIIFDTLPARYVFFVSVGKVALIPALMILGFFSFAWAVSGYGKAKRSVQRGKEKLAVQTQMAAADPSYVPDIAGHPDPASMPIPETTASAASPDLFVGRLTLEEDDALEVIAVQSTADPAPQPSAEPAPKTCPTCQATASFITEYSSYWCDTCQAYL